MYRRPARQSAPARQARRRTPPPPRRRNRRLRFVVVALSVGMVLAGGSAGLIAGLGRGATRPVASGPATLPTPGSYEILYSVSNLSSGTAQNTYEVLDVTDPLDISDLTYNSDPRSGAQPASGTVTTATALYELSGSKLNFVSGREPGLGSGAQAVGVELPQLVSSRMAERLGRTQIVAGSTCDLVRMSEPPAGPITALSGADHDDLCLTPSGLELAETWTYHGRVVLSRRALELRIGGTDSSIASAPALPAGAQSSSASLMVVGPVQTPSFLPTPPAPDGYTAKGPLAVAAANPEQTGHLLYESTIWTFVNAGSIVTVEAGKGGLPWADSGPAGPTVRLGALGPATEHLDSDGPDLHVELSGGRWVRIRGTETMAALVAYASGLAAPAGS